MAFSDTAPEPISLVTKIKVAILPDKIIKLLFDSLQCSLYIRIQIKEKVGTP